ncbi:hypothetical protein XocBAI15_16870 [Xanthomonas oryzae pv. oryzicola]|nr:hypothetical protein XocBAI15_16870 [Xanthomonas oryzae pv. oryzicola]
MEAYWLRRSERDSKHTRRRCIVCPVCVHCVNDAQDLIDLTYCASRHSSGSIVTHSAQRTAHSAQRTAHSAQR